MLVYLLIVTILHVVLVTQVEGWKGVVGRVQVNAEVSQRYSATLARVTLHNPHNRTDHVTLAMLLPADAFISSLTMETGGRNITTKVQEKRKTTGPKPSRSHHSTQGGRRSATQETQRFKASIKVAPLDQATFYLSYEQLLQRMQGRYTYTLHLPPNIGTGEQQVEVRVKEAEVIKNLQVFREPNPPSVTNDRTKDNEIIITYHRGGGREGREARERTEGGGGEEEGGGRGGGGGGDENTNSHIISHSNNSNRKMNTTTSDNSSVRNTSSAIVSSRSRRSVSSETNGTRAENMLSLTYDVERTTDGGEIQVRGRFFVHYLSPEGLPKLPAHTVFALDVSGSMSDHGKLDQLKKAIIAIIRAMPMEDSFEVLVFSTRVKSLGVYRALPNEVEEGVAKIQSLRALGGTNINEALLQAVTGANTHNATHAPARQVVFLTDGKPNIGETRPDQLRRNVREANLHHLPVFSLALGQDADVRLLRQVSSDNEGFMRTINEEGQPAEELQEFYGEISSPLLTNVDVMYNDNEVDTNSVIRQGSSNFYSGSEVVLAGQLREGAREVHPVVAGRGKEGPLQLRVSRTYTTEEPPVRDNHVERLWAYLTVQDLLDAIEIVDDRNLRVEMKARAKAIAVRFQFVTKLTTLKVDEEYSSQTHPGLKSGASSHKSGTGIGPDYELLSPSAIAQTLPPPLSSRIRASSPSSSPYFGDNDPHFVVQVPGMPLPLCFDIHASHGSTLTLIRDPHSGVVVNGQVTEALGRPDNTYFTAIFISIAGVNFTITTTEVTVDCLDTHGNPTVDDAASSLWPNKKKRAGKRRHKGRKEERTKRKSQRRANRRRRRDRRERKGSRASHSQRHMARERRRNRNRGRSRRSPGLPKEAPQGVNTPPQHYFRRRRRRRRRRMSRQDVLSLPTVPRILQPKDTNSYTQDFYSSTYPLNAIPHPHPPTHNYLQPFHTLSHPPQRPGSKYVLYPNRHPPQAVPHPQPPTRRHLYASQTSIHPLQELLHPQSRSPSNHHTLHPLSYPPQAIPHPQLPARSQLDASHTSNLQLRDPFHLQSQSPGNPNTFHPHSHPPQTVPHPQRHTSNHPHSQSRPTRPETRAHIQYPTHSRRHPFTTFIRTPQAILHHQQTQGHTYKSHPLNAGPQTIAHPQKPTHGRPLPKEWNQETSGLQYRTPLNQQLSTVALSRQIRASPHFNPSNRVLHPQAGEFLHPQAGVDISSPHFRYTARGRNGEDEGEGEGEDDGNNGEVQRECSRTLSWKKVSERRYGRVAVTLRNHRKLDFLVGDVALNLVVTRSRSAHGQHFLGVYLERRALLSPNTTGIIGQFVYKTVGTVRDERHGIDINTNQQDQKVRLAVVQPGPQRRYQVSEVNAFLSSRRSLLHKTQVTCLYIRDQGRGLVAGVPEDYILPCLEC